MRFLPLLALNLTHGYYTDGRCPDFQLIPTATTERLLRNHRCVLRTYPNGIRVLMSVTQDTIPVIPLADGATFSFHLILKRSDFPLFTELDTYHQTPAPQYTNAADATTLVLSSKQAEMTEPLVVTQPAAAAQYVLSGNPLAETIASQFTITGLGSITTPADYNAASKIVTVDTSSATQGDRFQISYPTRPQQARGTFADVEIQYHDTWPAIAEGPREFQISFEPKAAYWKYYVVADSSETQFQIQDQAPEALVFSAANRTDLNQNPDSSDELAISLAQKYPTKQRLRFVSDAAVPCQQQPRKAIQLRLADNLVIEPLPNPTLHNFGYVEVLIDGTPQQEPALYQIVKYFAR